MTKMDKERQAMLENILEIREISRIRYGTLTAYNKEIAKHKDQLGQLYLSVLSRLEEYVFEMETRALRQAAEKIDICFNYTMDNETIKKLVAEIAALGSVMRMGNGALKYHHQLDFKIKVCKGMFALCYGDDE